jgi:hypothetical protein
LLYFKAAGKEATVGGNCGLSQHSGSSSNVHRFTGHDRGLRKSEALTSDKEPNLIVNTAFCILVLLYNNGNEIAQIDFK